VRSTIKSFKRKTLKNKIFAISLIVVMMTLFISDEKFEDSSEVSASEMSEVTKNAYWKPS